MCVPESVKLFCVVDFGIGLPQRQPWAASGAGNIENQDFGVSGDARGLFWAKFDVGGCAARNVLNNMACRDGLGKEQAVLSNIFYTPTQIAKFNGR